MNRFLPSDFNERLRNSSNVRFRKRGTMRVYMRYTAYLVFAAGIGVAGYAAYAQAVNFVGSSRIFALKEVGISGYERVSPSDIIRASGLSIGENIFSIRLGAVRNSILSIPWISSVSIRKSPPHKIDIAVTERKAYCMILLDHLYYVDNNGMIFKQVTDSDPINYPIITGFNIKGQQFLDIQFQPVADAVSFIRELDRNSLIGSRDISELHVEDSGYTVITNDGLLIRFGSGDPALRIDRLNEIMKYFGDRMQMFSSIDFRFKGMGIIRYKSGIAGSVMDRGVPGSGSIKNHALTKNTNGQGPFKEVNSLDEER